MEHIVKHVHLEQHQMIMDFVNNVLLDHTRLVQERHHANFVDVEEKRIQQAPIVLFVNLVISQ